MANDKDNKNDMHLAEILEKVQAQLAALSERVEQLESAGPKQPDALAAVRSRGSGDAGTCAAARNRLNREITEEELIAISAALGAYLGVRIAYQTDSIAQLTRLGATGACVDPGVPQLT